LDIARASLEATFQVLFAALEATVPAFVSKQ
jgi:hypothetical protein